MLFKIKNKKFCTANKLFDKLKKTKKMHVQIKRLFDI